MKKFVLLFTTIALAFSAHAQQVPKKPLIEHFTQASCNPCASVNPIMYQTLDAFGNNNYVKLTYQVSWPGTDPMYNDYPNGADDRVAIHGISSVPSATLNGDTANYPITVVTAATLANAAAEMTNLTISSSHTYGTGRDMNVEVTVKNISSDTVTAGKTLISAMVEDLIVYGTAPGSNGETEFHNVVRNMYDASTGNSATTGTSLPALYPNDSVKYTFTVTLPSYIREYDGVGFAFFVEDSAGGNVLQSDYSSPFPNPAWPDMSTSNAVFDGTTGDYCDNTLTPAFTVTNVKSTPITSIEATYTLDNGTPVPVSVTGLNLTNGQSTTITFPAITLPVGSTQIEYNIVNVNNTFESSLNNNIGLIRDRVVTSPTAIDTGITTGFENLAIGTAAPNNAVPDNNDGVSAFVVNSAISNNVTWNLGGFGRSNNSFAWFCFSIPKAKSSKLIYEKIDLSGFTNSNSAWIKWSTAYAQYKHSGQVIGDDRLKVLVSTDCGATWTTIFDQYGAALSTAPASSNNFFPRASQWRKDSASLTPYLTSNELMVAFEGISDYGNNIYIDDIRTVVNNTVSVRNLEETTTNFEVFPNPVNNILNISFELEDATDLNISIQNSLGQTIQHVANQNFLGTTTLKVNTSKLAAGVYFVNAVSGNSVITKRFIVRR